MALGMNDFRSIVIKADAANTSIAPIRLSQNDQDGRRIVFELWDGAESISATGLTARLLFGVGEGGYATMTAVSGAATATWAVDVPQEALQTAGVVRMAVEVASGSQAVCTRIFDAVVEPALIDESSPEAQDALSEFRAAVARLEDFTVPVPISNGGTGSATAAGARSALAALGTAGGTMTGSVNFKSDTIDRDGANPSSTQISPTIIFVDKDGQRIGMVRSERNTSGVENLAIGTFSVKTADSSEVDNWLRIGVDSSGSRSVTVTDGAAWIVGLGITPAAIGAVPLMTSLTTDDDIDAMRTPGVWRTQGSSDLPSGALSGMTWAIVEVLLIGTTVLQRVTTYNKIWYRTGNLSSWQAWRVVTSSAAS